jgi:peptidyl-prolyl cis-trans isomerase C
MHTLPLLLLGAAVVARANGEVVTAEQVTARLARAHQMGLRATPKNIVDDLVTEALVAQDAYAKGWQRDPAVTVAVEQARRRLAAERFVAKEIDSAAKATDEQLLAMYHATADTAVVEVITLVSEEVARATLERLRRGASVADEAKFAVDPAQASGGGKPVTRTRAELGEELAQVVFSAPLATFVGPVTLPLGAAVVRVRECYIGSEQGFPAKKESLRGFVENQLRHQYKAHFLAQLRKAAGVKIDEDFLKQTGASLQLDQRADHVVAEVYGQPVRYGAVVEEVRRLAGGKEGGHASGPTVKAGYASALVDQLLLEHEAMARGYGKDPSLAEPLKTVERDAVLSLAGRRLRAQAGAPSATEVEEYYRSHPSEFQIPAVRACAHIVLPSREQANKVLANLQRGDRFEDLARDYSRDSASAANGGFLGNLGQAEIERMRQSGEKALAEALARSKPGQTSEPIPSRMGFHLIRCQAPSAAQTRPLAEVRAALTLRLTEQRGQEALVRHADELRRRGRVEIDEAAVARVEATHPQPRHPPR